MSRIIFTERATPDTPAANKIQLYAKTDGKLYYMADDGIEVEIGSGSITLPVGTNGQLLSLNDAEPTGLEWVDPVGAEPIHAHNKYADTSAIVGPDQSILAYEEFNILPGVDVEFDANSELVILTDGGGSGGGVTLPLAITDGGTGEITAEDALDALGGLPASIVTDLGDLIVGTGAGTVLALSAGTNGQLLSANDAEPTGLEWIDPPSGGASDHTALTNLDWAASGHTAPSAAVAGFDAAGVAIAVAPSSGYLVLTSKNGFLSWAPYALGLAFSLSTGEDMADLVVSSPVLITTGTFT